MGHYLKLKLFHEAKLIIYNIIYYYFDNSFLKFKIPTEPTIWNQITQYMYDIHKFLKTKCISKKLHKFCESVVFRTIK